MPTASGIYSVGAYSHRYEVSAFWSASDLTRSSKRYFDLKAAINSIIATHKAAATPDGGDLIIDPATVKDELITVTKGSYTLDGQFLPIKTKIIGGYAAAYASNIPDSKTNQTFVKPGNLTDPALYIANKNYVYTDKVSGGKTHMMTVYNSLIDGFIFDGLDNLASDVTAQAGAINISGAWHVKNVHISNCVFLQNKGRMAGAVFANNASQIFFDNCVFTGNKSVAGGTFTDPVCNVSACRDGSTFNTQPWSGGAVSVFEFELCGVEIEFNSCIFYKNNTEFSKYSGSDSKRGGTVAIYGGAGKSRPVKIVNCTFTGNTIAGAAATSARSVYSGGYESMSGTPIVCLNNVFWNDAGASGVTNEVIGISAVAVEYYTNVYDFSVDLTTVPSTDKHSFSGLSYCDLNGYTLISGDNNDNVDPQFTDATKITDATGRYLTADDGLNLKNNSPMRKRALNYNAALPEYVQAGVYNRAKFVDAASRDRLAYNTGTVAAPVYRTDMGAYEKNYRVLCIGDDLTRGNGYLASATKADKAWAYRATLKNQFKSANIELDFVGSTFLPPYVGKEWSSSENLDCLSALGNDDLSKDIQHYGFNNAKSVDFIVKNSVTGKYLINSDVLNVLKPDIVLILIGSAEVAQDVTAGTTMDDNYFKGISNNINELTKVIHTWMGSERTNKRIFVGSLPPQDPAEPDNEQAVINLNDKLSKTVNTTYINTLSSTKYLVDIFNAKHPDDNSSYSSFVDIFKFNKKGMEIISNGWWKDIYPNLP